MPRLLRITTVPISLTVLLNGQFHYMREHGFEVIAMSAYGKEVQDVVKDGTKHIVIPFTRKITPFRDLNCLWQLVREMKNLKPDIVHTHTPKAGLLGMLAAWFCRVPVRLHTVAGLPLMEARGLKRLVLKITEKITYSCAQCVYPNSLGLQKFIEQQFQLPAGKLRLLAAGSSNGIDTFFFRRSEELENHARRLRAEYNIRQRDIVFSFVGRIVRDKGIVELVKAFKEISEDRDVSDRKFFLILVGHFEEKLDPLPPDIMQFIRSGERVILTGFESDIRPWLMASDIFVFPSYREGFPNVVMQAGLLKVPCIVSDINGCNELVKDGWTGTIVRPKDVNGLVQAMRKVSADEAIRKYYSENAHEFVARNFQREIIWGELLKEYKRTMRMQNIVC